MIDRDHLLAIVREAGRIAHSRWPGAGHDLHSWDKTPGNPVSEADLEVDRFLRRELGRLLPSAAWLSEETADDKARTASGLISTVVASTDVAMKRRRRAIATTRSSSPTRPPTPRGSRWRCW